MINDNGASGLSIVGLFLPDNNIKHCIMLSGNILQLVFTNNNNNNIPYVVPEKVITRGNKFHGTICKV